MAYISKTGLQPLILQKNGQNTVEFLEFETRYQNTYIQYITEYYNPITGLYDNTKTQIYFEGNDSLLINQNYAATAAELT